MTEKYLLRMPGGKLVRFRTHQSRAEGKWVAWHPDNIVHVPGTHFVKFVERLSRISRATYHVDSTQRKAAIGLAKELKATLYAADQQTMEVA